MKLNFVSLGGANEKNHPLSWLSHAPLSASKPPLDGLSAICYCARVSTQFKYGITADASQRFDRLRGFRILPAGGIAATCSDLLHAACSASERGHNVCGFHYSDRKETLLRVTLRPEPRLGKHRIPRDISSTPQGGPLTDASTWKTLESWTNQPKARGPDRINADNRVNQNSFYSGAVNDAVWFAGDTKASVGVSMHLVVAALAGRPRPRTKKQLSVRIRTIRRTAPAQRTYYVRSSEARSRLA